MAAKEKSADRGARLGRAIVRAMGEELRRGRIAADLTQDAIGKALGWSRSKVSRVERGLIPVVSFLDLARALAVVGLELSVRAYPTGSPMRDRAHLALLERFRQLLSPLLDWRTEVPLPNPGDLRAWDGFIRCSGIRIGVECETRVTDWQELDRRTSIKHRDGGVDHVILVLANTRHNRTFVRDHAEAIAASFPLDAASALAALAAGRDPGGSAVILL